MRLRPETKNCVSYNLLDHLADFLICSRCFRQNRVQPICRPLSERHQPIALCRQCSAESNAEHQADLHVLERPSYTFSY